jgi:hypothetical protein
MGFDLLRNLNLLEQALEPSKRGSIAENPEAFDATEGTEGIMLLPVPDVFDDRGEGSDTNTSTDKDSNFGFETSSAGALCGPSIPTTGRGRVLALGSSSTKSPRPSCIMPDLSSFSKAFISACVRDFTTAGVAPTRSPSAWVQSPTWRMGIDT